MFIETGSSTKHSQFHNHPFRVLFSVAVRLLRSFQFRSPMGEVHFCVKYFAAGGNVSGEVLTKWRMYTN